MARATVDMCKRPLRLPYSLPNILLDDLANVRKEFVMRKSRPSITNVSFCGPADLPTFVRCTYVSPRSSTSSSDSARILDAGQIAKFLADILSPPVCFRAHFSSSAPSSSGRNYLNQFPGQRHWTVVGHTLRHGSHSFTCGLCLGLLITSLNIKS